tara:strand:- start:1164 stop:1442 length:279 start_codon:yes stop_codon:yes gene_type:complete
MDEGEILDMGRRLMAKHEELEKERKVWSRRVAGLQKNLAMLYTFGRELDMMLEDDNSIPPVMKYLVERIRGLSSALLFEDVDDPAEITIILP